MRYAGGLGWPRLSGKTGEFSAGSMATRAGFRITHWQSRPSFAVYSGWTWRKTAFILPILIKFTYKGGNVSISAAASPESVILKVKDSGMGIEPKRIEDLFSPHKNLSTQGTYQEKGTGLGLVLCKEFIDKHNGEIWVESEEGMGSEFFIKLFQ